MKPCLISYPGLSEELVINTNYQCHQFYELVSSCGVFCRMPVQLQEYFLADMVNAHPEIKGYIFVTDEMNAVKLSPLLKKVLPDVKIVTFQRIPYINSQGLRVNKSELSQAVVFKDILKKYKDYPVLVSTPYSCPDLSKHIKNEDSISNRSSLFYFEDKRIYTEYFSTETNFIQEYGVGEIKELIQFLDNNPDKLYFLKPLGNFTGGTTVLSLNSKIARHNEDHIAALLARRRCFLFQQIDALNVSSPQGIHMGTQFRIFLNQANEPVSFIIKFVKEPSNNDSNKTSLKRLNAQFNSSSGTAVSILYRKQADMFVPVRISYGKDNSTNDNEELDDILKNYKLGKFSLNEPQDLEQIVEILLPQAIRIKKFFHEFFFEQKWEDLYKRFVAERTYFN